MQIPSCLHRSSDIISALDDGSRNVAELVYIVKEIVLHRKPTSMNITLTEIKVWRESVTVVETKSALATGI
jgi:hypothetical protein